MSACHFFELALGPVRLNLRPEPSIWGCVPGMTALGHAVFPRGVWVGFSNCPLDSVLEIFASPKGVRVVSNSFFRVLTEISLIAAFFFAF